VRLLLGLVGFVLVGWGVGELLLSVVGWVDLNAVREVAAGRSGIVTYAARVVTWAGSALLLVGLASVVCPALGLKGLRREALAVAFSLGGAILIAAWVKLLVMRPRPPIKHLQAVTSSSFPSGHATQAGAFWLSLVLALHTAGAPPTTTGVTAGFALMIFLGVAASRVYLGVHYPSDGAAGVLLGTGWALYVSHCLRRREVQ
jgi:undecaprenyl-diphosphatase